MTLKLIVSFAVAFFISAGLGAYLVPWLRRLKAGQVIREDGPTWHSGKAGTPTMGGLIFITAVAAVCITVGFPLLQKGELGHIFCLLFSLVFGFIGFLDDYEKLRKKQNLGLTARMKFLLQLTAAVAFIFLLRRYGYLSPNLYIPFWNVTLHLPETLYVVFAAFAVVATVNAVNITDGADGLATGSSLPVFLYFSVIALVWGERYLDVGIFSSGLTGALLGFLLYNFHPAQVFMGDTGSLFLGGAVCGLAFAMDMPLIILVIGFIFVVEILSDVIQILYYKLSHGKRVFRMAPFHHHLEMGGWTGRKWSEKELFVLFFTISLICAVLAFAGTYDRFIF